MKQQVSNRVTSDQRGQTLVEVIFGIVAITTALASFLSLTVLVTRAERVDRSRVIASQLAREGIELVRGLRDSAWLADQPWHDTFRGSNGDTTATVGYGTLGGDIRLSFTPNTAAEALLFNHDGVWTHDSGGTATGFSRLVTLEPLCTAALPLPDPLPTCSSSGAIVGFRVTSDAAWQERGAMDHVTLTEYLYDWR